MTFGLRIILWGWTRFKNFTYLSWRCGRRCWRVISAL